VIRDAVLVTAEAFIALAVITGALGLLGRLERGIEYWWGFGCVTDILLAAYYALDSNWPATGLYVVLAAGCAEAWRDHHRKNRGKRRAVDALGAKSRALREALVRRAREVARPRPVLRPVPGRVR